MPPALPSAEEVVANRSFFGHPRGLGTLFAVEMWERFSFYGLRPLLILFMTAALTSKGFGFDRPKAAAIVGIYAACVYLSSLPGGWIADRWLGLQRSIWWGGVIIALGHLSIGLSAIFAQRAFFLGLVLIVIGTGMLKPNISATVGDLYPEGGARRDAGFSIYYMGINTGAFFGQLVTGYLGERVGWHLGFGAAGVGMVCGLITFRAFAVKTLGPVGLGVSVSEAERLKTRTQALAALVAVFAFVLLAMFGVIPIDPVKIASYGTAGIITLAVVYFAFLFVFGGLESEEKKRIGLIFVLFLGAAAFWSAFEQAPTSLNLFARDFTDRNILGFDVPATWFQSINTFFVVGLAPVFAKLWVGLGKRGIVPSSPTKFTFGLLCCGLAFYLMLIPANAVIASGGTLKVSVWWLTLSYLLQTFGELSLSPVGLSSMTKLAPRRYVGQMMGVWFMASALGNLIAGLVGGNIDPEKLDLMPQLFNRTALSLFAMTAVFALLIVPVRNMMRNTSMKEH
ncbi:MAG TPA: peptide MFS transporter [Gemmatimonadaceae bacterium]|nr:peptide MFS transporter [Gemmatimonadaceae bacterium]